MAAATFEKLSIPKPPGIYFFQEPPDYDPSRNWVHRILYWPRSYSAWISYIRELRKPLLIRTLAKPIYVPNTVPDPWFHREEAADMLESWFQRNQCIRWQMNRLVAVFRRRIMDRRVIGETDVGTMETIPTQHVVQVYDWSSRSKYRFHANTIHSNILAALRYYTMAISMPRKPKNPYTNMEWTTGQMWVLVDQIQRQFWENGHRFIDPALQIYSREFSVDSLRKLYGKQLSVDCARRFFKDRTSDCWDAIYEETLADLFVILKPTRSFFIRSLILERSLKTELLCAWDEMTAAFWCYENLNQLISQNVSSIVDLIENAKRLLASTEVFIRTRRENRMKKKQATS